jgi:hypothetical protein
MALSKEFIDILACPRCKGAVEPLANGSGLLCRPCRLKYPVRDDIPVMLIEEAERLSEE